MSELTQTQRFQFYFARALQMGNEEWSWVKILNYLKGCNLTDEEIQLIKDKLNEECRLH